jgi:hypothetical protein
VVVVAIWTVDVLVFFVRGEEARRQALAIQSRIESIPPMAALAIASSMPGPQNRFSISGKPLQLDRPTDPVSGANSQRTHPKQRLSLAAHIAGTRRHGGLSIPRRMINVLIILKT